MFGAEPFRMTPALGAESYKTYRIQAPRSTHRRKATCAEVRCENYERGWATRIDERTELGQRQAGYIRTVAGRHFTEGRDAEGWTVFTFPAEQQCFGEHYVSLDRSPQFLVVGGDWRGNPRGESVIHRSFDDWANDFGDHQERLKRAHEG